VSGAGSADGRRRWERCLADSGEAAIEKLVEKPDVVVLDDKMPGMDGHQTLREIKKRLPDLPVIMLTGHGARPSAREGTMKPIKRKLRKWQHFCVQLQTLPKMRG